MELTLQELGEASRLLALGFSCDAVARTIGVSLRTVWLAKQRGHLPRNASCFDLSRCATCGQEYNCRDRWSKANLKRQCPRCKKRDARRRSECSARGMEAKRRRARLRYQRKKEQRRRVCSVCASEFAPLARERVCSDLCKASNRQRDRKKARDSYRDEQESNGRQYRENLKLQLVHRSNVCRERRERFDRNVRALISGGRFFGRGSLEDRRKRAWWYSIKRRFGDRMSEELRMLLEERRELLRDIKAYRQRHRGVNHLTAQS
jgi:hypothetical protein